MSRETIARAISQDGTAGHVLTSGSSHHGRGLRLTSRLIAANGAQLAIDSTPGEGTSVQITVPADRLVLV